LLYCFMEIRTHNRIQNSCSIKSIDCLPGLIMHHIQGNVAFLIPTCNSTIIDSPGESKRGIQIQTKWIGPDLRPEDSIETTRDNSDKHRNDIPDNYTV
jgi:hypothetical protein